ncbi:VapC toxin family PIN domain ribonuclease [Mycolicibacterium sp. GF69]|uniref:type II toxin-antitoxin system VapC family toxin n=1 Tax=Mycolicibacterium sp. GF69 TaxID=2267251 RepID=UPI000DCDA01D|nr:PIN domain nuclease [Mycolicibacterium sp. GF69]RAV10080.1 VapC toxin family PIN domain ribonuclease [Mycolicibacterium sp. GF69]
MILIDTSAWVEYLRATGSSAAIEVRRLLTEQVSEVAMCEPIAMEILAGAGDVAYAKLERLVNGLPILAFDAASDFRSAAAIYRAARRGGRTIHSLNDCLIAAVAIRHEAEVVHRDADYDVIASIAPLVATSVA